MVLNTVIIAAAIYLLMMMATFMTTIIMYCEDVQETKEYYRNFEKDPGMREPGYYTVKRHEALERDRALYSSKQYLIVLWPVLFLNVFRKSFYSKNISPDRVS